MKRKNKLIFSVLIITLINSSLTFAATSSTTASSTASTSKYLINVIKVLDKYFAGIKVSISSTTQVRYVDCYGRQIPSTTVCTPAMNPNNTANNRLPFPPPNYQNGSSISQLLQGVGSGARSSNGLGNFGNLGGNPFGNNIFNRPDPVVRRDEPIVPPVVRREPPEVPRAGKFSNVAGCESSTSAAAASACEKKVADDKKCAEDPFASEACMKKYSLASDNRILQQLDAECKTALSSETLTVLAKMDIAPTAPTETVSPGRIAALYSGGAENKFIAGEDKDVYKKSVSLIREIIPKKAYDALENFQVYNLLEEKTTDNYVTLAFVFPKNGGEKMGHIMDNWVYGFAYKTLSTFNKRTQVLTAIHESAHILSLFKDQTSIDGVNTCSGYFSSSYAKCYPPSKALGAFYNAFWKDKKSVDPEEYKKCSTSPQNFVSCYATKNVLEDFAETFSTYVLYCEQKKLKNFDDGTKSKIAFFNLFPEMRGYKDEILKNIEKSPTLKAK